VIPNDNSNETVRSRCEDGATGVRNPDQAITLVAVDSVCGHNDLPGRNGFTLPWRSKKIENICREVRRNLSDKSKSRETALICEIASRPLAAPIGEMVIGSLAVAVAGIIGSGDFVGAGSEIVGV
jgi:hypothetical protein